MTSHYVIFRLFTKLYSLELHSTIKKIHEIKNRVESAEICLCLTVFQQGLTIHNVKKEDLFNEWVQKTGYSQVKE